MRFATKRLLKTAFTRLLLINLFKSGLRLKESFIDSYWTGNISLGLAQHGSHFDLDLETAYIDSLFIPNLTVRAGKFYTFLGRHNNLHSHHSAALCSNPNSFQAFIS